MKIMLRTIVFLATMAGLILPAYAQNTSRECATESTDVTLSYGNGLVCAIESAGDSDLFSHFWFVLRAPLQEPCEARTTPVFNRLGSNSAPAFIKVVNRETYT